MLSMDLKFVARFNVWKFAARSNVMAGNLLLYSNVMSGNLLCLDLIIFSFFQLKVAKDRKKGDKIVNDRSVWAAF